MPALHAVHDTDPRKDLMKKIGRQQIDNIELFGNAILVAVYQRPSKAQFGTLKIDLPDKTRDEDRYQGKVGLIVKQGKMAWVDDEQVSFNGQKCVVGDWVVFRPSDGQQLTLTGNQVLCRVLRESSIIMKIASPDAIW